MKGSTTTLLLCSSLFATFIVSSNAGDTVTPSQAIRDSGAGGDTVVSAGGVFELGFFTPGNSGNRYLGIWYHEISPLTVVWVANRESPLAQSSGVLNLTNQGTLLLLNGTTDTIIWSSNSSSSSTKSPVAQLLDSGNFVIRDQNEKNPEEFLWQSFDHPCDTLLSGMRIGKNGFSGPEKYLSSWRSSDDPSPGEFTVRVDPDRYAQLVESKGSKPLGFSGPWNGVGFSGTPGFRSNQYFKFEFEFNSTDMYYSYQTFNKSLITRYVLNQTGEMQRQIWLGKNQGWLLYLSVAPDNCFRYALCGPYSRCNPSNLPLCGCLKGFVPKSPQEWDSSNWSKGCQRAVPLDCGRGTDEFVKYSGAKLPDALYYWQNGSMSLQECRFRCLSNCSCTAYTNLDIRGKGSGCLIWFGDLVDIRDSIDNGQDVYIRMAASEQDDGEKVKLNNRGSSGMKRRVIIIAITIALAALVLLSLSLVLYIRKKKQRRQKDDVIVKNTERDCTSETEQENIELPIFDLATIACATGNFSIHQKLGEGGFGPVYKGILKDGQEIAVKRLSKNSNQGINEFKNEVLHIAKLQHRNLVRLLGCCIQANETMLVYEYMPNKSLDSLIFNQTASMILDWPRRFHIINGIARGLLYLHQDSRLRIIHRDLKASNVLIDKDMNPKISDFGMARSFGGNETEANTKRVVGTYGYMSPEYAIEGLYSTKSDVFSFGVLILEIISGKRNRGFLHPNHHLNLLGHAWKLHGEDRALELIDASVKDSCSPSEVLRSIHLGLLCVQQFPDDRPNMLSVVLILGSEGELPSPKQPGFYAERDPHGVESSSGNQVLSSGNDLSITLLEAR